MSSLMLTLGTLPFYEATTATTTYGEPFTFLFTTPSCVSLKP